MDDPVALFHQFYDQAHGTDVEKEIGAICALAAHYRKEGMREAAGICRQWDGPSADYYADAILRAAELERELAAANERDATRARIVSETGAALAAVQSECNFIKNVGAGLQAENERLRSELAAAEKDAARYRWLRQVEGNFMVGKLHSQPQEWHAGESLDAAIDAAIAKEKP